MATKTKKSSTPAVKKTAPKTKKVSAKKSTVEKYTSSSSAPVTTPHQHRSFRMRRSHVLVLGGVILAITALYFLRSYFIAATVNGAPISRLAVVRDAEKQQGKAILDNLVTKKLIQQEAEKKNVTISDEEIDQEVKKITDDLKSRGQDLNTELEKVGWKKSDLEEDIRLRKLVEKMAGGDVQVTDKEVADYIEQNKASFPEDAKPEDLQKDVKEQLRQTKLSEKIQPWIESLQKNAKINYFVTY